VLLIEEIRQVFNVDLHIGIYRNAEKVPCLRYVELCQRDVQL
jgi:hypothetical protein